MLNSFSLQGSSRGPALSFTLRAGATQPCPGPALQTQGSGSVLHTHSGLEPLSPARALPSKPAFSGVSTPTPTHPEDRKHPAHATSSGRRLLTCRHVVRYAALSVPSPPLLAQNALFLFPVCLLPRFLNSSTLTSPPAVELGFQCSALSDKRDSQGSSGLNTTTHLLRTGVDLPLKETMPLLNTHTHKHTHTEVHTINC